MNKTQRFCIICNKETVRGKKCGSCASKEWRERNKDKVSEYAKSYNKIYYARNKKPVTPNKCLFCELEFEHTFKRPDQKYCSRLCRDRQWRNDNRELYRLRKKEEQVRNADAYYKRGMKYHNKIRFGGLRENVLDRDNHKCLDCGSENLLIVHHKDFTKDNNTMDNLETLCRACHIRKHTHVLRVTTPSN